MTKPETTQESIAQIIAPMGAPKGDWPNRRAATLRLPKGYSTETTITDESADVAFSPWIPPPAVTPAMLATSLAFVAAPYAAVTYAPMTRAALLDGCDDTEECPPTIRSFK